MKIDECVVGARVLIRGYSDREEGTFLGRMRSAEYLCVVRLDDGSLVMRDIEDLTAVRPVGLVRDWSRKSALASKAEREQAAIRKEQEGNVRHLDL